MRGQRLTVAGTLKRQRRDSQLWLSLGVLTVTGQLNRQSGAVASAPHLEDLAGVELESLLGVQLLPSEALAVGQQLVLAERRRLAALQHSGGTITIEPAQRPARSV